MNQNIFYSCYMSIGFVDRDRDGSEYILQLYQSIPQGGWIMQGGSCLDFLVLLTL